MYIDPKQTLKKSELAGVLERICQALELTETQHALAKSHYEAVGTWLAEAEEPMLRRVSIYPQGSTAIGTTVKPLWRDEHDVDLVSFVLGVGLGVPPALLKKVIGDRLRANRRYADILEEKPRCWRLNYAGQFHLDITPSIKNPRCPNGGELVPDKKLREWKPTNPKGYKALFERRAALQPRMRLAKAIEAMDFHAAEVAPFPSQARLKGLLRRSVQLAKRHRDIYFQSDKDGLAPISVIITTLAARAYEHCVNSSEYDTELDLLCDVVRYMPAFIETRTIAGRPQWFIWNETTAGENFAEKWNANPRLAEAFFAWQAQLGSDVEGLLRIIGQDVLAKSLTASFGDAPVSAAFDAMTREVSTARTAGKLALLPTVGLRAGLAGAAVPSNTFFGAP